MKKEKCQHKYYINEYNKSECKHCGLLESTIKNCYPEEYNVPNKENLINKFEQERINSGGHPCLTTILKEELQKIAEDVIGEKIQPQRYTDHVDVNYCYGHNQKRKKLINYFQSIGVIK